VVHEEGIMPSKRELIDTGTDKRYVRRDEKGRFKESDDVGRSLSQDVKKRAKKVVPPGTGRQRRSQEAEEVDLSAYESETMPIFWRSAGAQDGH
jgi:hypothetical protein